MTPSDSGAAGESGRRAQQLKTEKPGILPGWRSNFSAVRSLEEENRRLRAETERLKKELDRNRWEVLRSASAWRDEHRWRTQAEHAWRQNFNSFFRWVDDLVFGLTCFSADGVAIHVNQAMLKLLGYSREEYLGKKLGEIIVESLAVKRIRAAMEGGELPNQHPVHLRTQKGGRKAVLLSCQPFDHGAVNGLCCHVQPIPRIERDPTNCRNYSIFRQISGNMREVFWVTDVTKSRTFFISPVVEEVCGISAEQLYRNPKAFLSLIHPEDRERVTKAIPKQVTGDFREEYRLLLPNGSTRWVRDRAFPIRNKAGRVYRLAGVVEDITALKAAETAMAVRARQQMALAELGRSAMEKASLQEFFEETVETVAKVLSVEFCKILEFRLGNSDFLMRAGVGWPSEMIGRAGISSSEASQAAFTLGSEFPVVVDNLAAERRFEGAPLLWDWGVRSGVTVRIGHRSRPFGVFGVHSRSSRKFSHDDVHFLEAAASLLAASVERFAAEDRQERLSLELIQERQRLNNILETVPGVVWELLWDDERKAVDVTFVSDHVEELTGFPRQMWLGKTDFWVKRLHPDDRQRMVENLRRGFEGRDMEKATRFRLLTADDEMIWLESRKQIFHDRKGKRIGVRGVLLNVTAEVEAEAELRTAEAHFRAFMDHSPVIAFIKNPEGRYIYGNKAFDELVHRMRPDWMNRTDHELFPPVTADWFQSHDKRAIEEQRTIQTVEVTHEEDGTPKYWTVFKFPLTNEKEEKCVGAVGVDITERRRLEQEILQISDREQRRMGQDLHDGLCQHLLGLALMAASLADRLEKEGSAHEKNMREVSQLLYDAVGLARGLMRGLHLVSLEGGGLTSALQEFCHTTSRLFGRGCDVEIQRPFTVTDKDLATHLFRISQEATNNAIKHGNAQNIRILASEVDGGLTITVEDDGYGLPDQIPSSGLGLQTMKYRAELIGATFSLENRIGGGTIMRCGLPPNPNIRFE